MGRKAEVAEDRRRGWGEGTIVERVAKDGTTTFLARVNAGGKRLNKTHKTRVAAQK